MNVKMPIKIQYGESSIEVLTKYEDILIEGNMTEASGDEEIIQVGLFSYCSLLQSVSFSQCTTIGDRAFINCSSLQLVNFPQCTTIGSNAFAGCSSLQSINFPQCTSIGSNAFYNCTSLQSVYLLASSVCTLVGGNAFIGTPIDDSSYLGYFGSIYVPSSLVDSYKTATDWELYSNRITAFEG